MQYHSWLLGRDGEWRQATVAEGRRHGKTVVARIDGFDDREQAAGLIGAEIAVLREALPETGEGQYYWSDLVGFEVQRSDGSTLGILDHLLETGAHDVMVVKGESERLIPFVKNEVVLGVDLEAGVITVDWNWD